MGAGHDHSHGANASARMLVIALALTGTFLLAELAGAYIFKSLALLSDAAHMFTDVAALAIALAAIKIGARPADDRRTFGYRRFEVLAAAFNAILLFAVAAYVLVEGVRRIASPEPVASTGMLAVALIGLVINLISMRLLAKGKDSSLNVKGAYLEVWADMLGSIGVVIGALAIMVTGWRWIDPVIAIAIGLWVLPRTWTLLRDTMNILLEGTPSGIDLPSVRSGLLAVPGVASVHDLHIWTSGADTQSATAHVVLAEGSEPDAVRAAVSDLLRAKFALGHVTIQVEVVGGTDEQDGH